MAAGSTPPLSQDAASVRRKNTWLGVRNWRRSARTAAGGTAPQHRLSDPARRVLAPQVPEMGVASAKLPARIITGGLFDESLIAQIMVAKFDDQQEQAQKRGVGHWSCVCADFDP